MKKFFIVMIIGAGIFLLYQRFVNKPHEIELLYEKPYIVVYGKDSCGWTQKYLENLKNTSFQYIYKNLGNKDAGDELHPRMKRVGLDTKYYLLPVIDINGNLLIRPEMDKIVSIYQKK